MIELLIWMGIGFVAGIVTDIALHWLREELRIRKWKKKREAKDAVFRKERLQEINKDLDGPLAWTITGGVTREKMIEYLDHVFFSEDRENLVYLWGHIHPVMRERGIKIQGVPLEKIIYLVRVDERKHTGDKYPFEITMNIGILPSFIEDVDERRRCIEDIIDRLNEGIHDTYGDAGEMDLHVNFWACEEEDEV